MSELVSASDVAGQARRDLLAAQPLVCPACSSILLQPNRPRYGWGAMGAQLRCPRCRLEVRIPWSQLERVARARAKAPRSAWWQRFVR